MGQLQKKLHPRVDICISMLQNDIMFTGRLIFVLRNIQFRKHKNICI